MVRFIDGLPKCAIQNLCLKILVAQNMSHHESTKHWARRFASRNPKRIPQTQSVMKIKRGTRMLNLSRVSKIHWNRSCSHNRLLPGFSTTGVPPMATHKRISKTDLRATVGLRSERVQYLITLGKAEDFKMEFFEHLWLFPGGMGPHLDTSKFATNTLLNAWHPIGVRKSRRDVPAFICTHELQHIAQNVTHSSTFPCNAIANATLSF